MEDLFTIDEKQLSISNRMVRAEVMRRGWPKGEVILGSCAFLTLTRPDGKIVKVMGGSAPETTSLYAGTLATDKYAAYCALTKIGGVKQPETVWLHADKNLQEKELTGLLAKHKNIVIKPLDGAHGNNVFTEIADIDAAKAACAKIAAEEDAASILAQEQITAAGPEMRVLCIDYQFVAAYYRIPAQVTGDGTHTVRELIEIENQTLRTEAYKSPLAFIDAEMAEGYIEKHGIAEKIPEAGEKVQVIGMCNAGRGGTMEDAEPTISEAAKAAAERIARELKLPVIGVDFYGDYVIEVNRTPSLYFSQKCVEKFVDYLEKI